MTGSNALDDPNGTGTAHPAEMDGIHRATRRAAGGGRTRENTAWQVSLRRHGIRLARTFSDTIWGGSDAALAMAQAWRDAVTDAVPPITNHHAATRLQARNTTGIAGVSRNVPRDRPQDATWLATLTARDGPKKQAFSVSAHGEDGARDRAIAQRRQWLAELPPRYHAMCDTTRAAAARNGTPAAAPSLAPVPLLMPDEIAARLPRRLRWRVRAVSAARPDGPLVVFLSDARRPPRRYTRTVSPKGRPLADRLAEATDGLRADTTDLYGPRVADWFVRTHLAPALIAERFDPATGAMDCVVVPGEDTVCPGSRPRTWPTTAWPASWIALRRMCSGSGFDTR